MATEASLEGGRLNYASLVALHWHLGLGSCNTAWKVQSRWTRLPKWTRGLAAQLAKLSGCDSQTLSSSDKHGSSNHLQSQPDP